MDPRGTYAGDMEKDYGPAPCIEITILFEKTKQKTHCARCNI